MNGYNNFPNYRPPCPPVRPHPDYMYMQQPLYSHPRPYFNDQRPPFVNTNHPHFWDPRQDCNNGFQPHRGFSPRGRGGHYRHNHPRNNDYQNNRNAHNFNHNRAFPNTNGGPRTPNQGKQKKVKEVVFDFFCEVCDRGFKTADKYKEHCDGHEKCGVEGCKYVAAPKLVKLHYEYQHKTGMAKQIWKLESKEDIEKWRVERKKNFPTKENIEKKKKTLQDRIERGEVIEQKEFGKMRGRGRGRGGRQPRYPFDDSNGHQNRNEGQRGRNRYQNRKRGRQEERGQHSINVSEDTSEKAEPVKSQNNEEIADKKRKLEENSDPLSSIIASIKDLTEATSDLETDTSSDSESEPEERSSVKPTEGTVNASQSSQARPDSGQDKIILCQYSDSDSEETEKTKEDNTDLKTACETRKKNERNQRDSRGPHPHTRGGGRTGERGRRGRGGHAQQRPQPPARQRPSLLQKLLAGEIRHERNVIMQCIRHIVKNQLFGVGAPESEVNEQGNAAPEDRAHATTKSEGHDQATTPNTEDRDLKTITSESHDQATTPNTEDRDSATTKCSEGRYQATRPNSEDRDNKTITSDGHDLKSTNSEHETTNNSEFNDQAKTPKFKEDRDQLSTTFTEGREHVTIKSEDNNPDQATSSCTEGKEESIPLKSMGELVSEGQREQSANMETQQPS